MYNQIVMATDKEIGEIPVVLVGNKCDMDDYRQVSTTEGKELAAKWKNCSFIEASAKTNHNVEKAFFDAVRLHTKSFVNPEQNVEDLKQSLKETKEKKEKPKVKKGGLFSSISEHNVDDDLEAVQNK